jgi:cell division protease FtsH
MKWLQQALSRFRALFAGLSPVLRLSVLICAVVLFAGGGFALVRHLETAGPGDTTTGLAHSALGVDAPVTALIPVRGQLQGLQVREGESSFDIVAQFSDGSKREFKGVSVFAYRTLQELLAPDIASGRLHLDLNSAHGDGNWSTRDIVDLSVKIFLVLAVVAVICILVFHPTMLDGRMRAADLVRPESNDDSFDALIGLEDVKAEVMQLKAMYEDAEHYRSYGIEKPFNVLFSGPAGVGKTRLAGALARELGLPLLHASGSNLESGFVGGGSRALKSIHRMAKKHKRAVVFLDEAQVLLVKRGQHTSQSKYADETTNTLLSLLDGVSRNEDRGIIWIVASNFDDQSLEMDDAVMRRFPLKVNFRLPNREERERILRHYLDRRAARVVPDLDTGHVAEVTAGLAPALLETLVERASLIAVQEDCQIDEALLMRAFERVAVGLTDRKTTENQSEARKVIAVHELGHFFVTLNEAMKKGRTVSELRRQLPVIKISTEAVSKGNALGFVLMRQKESPLATRSELEGKVRGLYGGGAAEEVFFGQDEITTGAYDDIRKATELMKKMVVELAMYSSSKVNMAMLGSKEQAASGTDEIKALAERLFADARTVVETHKPAIEALSEELVRRYTFTIDEILERLLAMGIIEADREEACAA